MIFVLARHCDQNDDAAEGDNKIRMWLRIFVSSFCNEVFDIT